MPTATTAFFSAFFLDKPTPPLETVNAVPGSVCWLCGDLLSVAHQLPITTDASDWANFLGIDGQAAALACSPCRRFYDRFKHQANDRTLKPEGMSGPKSALFGPGWTRFAGHAIDRWLFKEFDGAPDAWTRLKTAVFDERPQVWAALRAGGQRFLAPYLPVTPAFSPTLRVLTMAGDPPVPFVARVSREEFWDRCVQAADAIATAAREAYPDDPKAYRAEVAQRARRWRSSDEVDALGADLKSAIGSLFPLVPLDSGWLGKPPASR